MRQALAFFAPATAVLTLPAWDCLPYDRVSPNPDISARRMATLAALAAGRARRLRAADHAECRHPAPARARGAARGVLLGRVSAAGSTKAALRHFLARMGFSQTSTVSEPGDYAVRGGIIDIYPPGEGGPVRLDLFGDVLDGARRFDPGQPAHHRKAEHRSNLPRSRKSSSTRPRSPGSGRTTASNSAPAAATIRFTRRSARAASIRAWSTGCPSSTTSWRRSSTICPQASVMLDDQVTAARLSRWESIADQYDARREAMTRQGPARHRLQTLPAGPALSRRRGMGSGTWPSRRVIQLQPAAAGHRARACWTPAAASGAISRPSVSWKTSAFSGPWQIIFAQDAQDGQVVIAS